MIKMIFTFLVVFALFFFGFSALHRLPKREVWDLTKLLTYSAFCAIMTIVTLTFVVIIF